MCEIVWHNGLIRFSKERMPEAPEVEAVVQTLRPFVEGKHIRRVRVRHNIAVRPQSPSLLNLKLAGSQILGVERHGKHLLLSLDRGCVAMHFKFDGQLLWFDKSEDALTDDIHVDVLFEMEAGTLGFVDPRHLGRVQWLARPEDSTSIKALGVDAFSKLFTLPRLVEICRDRPRPIKILLMDQTRIAGIGNIYAAESLWRARLSPLRRSDHLTSGESRALHKAVVSVLARALECCLHPPPDFRDPQWWFTGLERMLRVYGREGRPCRRCGSKIRRIEQGGRSTYFCAHCQRM
jgi:formamidopyrimidine-DNA glycosylase